MTPVNSIGHSAMSKPFFVLAPMDDVTDVVFRSVVAECAPPDVFFTEFVNVDGLCSRGRPNLLHKLSINPVTDHNIVAQIWGKNPANYHTVANELVDMGFHGVDINMGCPQKNEVKNGCCSALINDRDLAGAMITATMDGVEGRLPVSVKCRLGWNEIDLSWHEYLLGFRLDMLSIHMRTRKEMSSVPAHWEVITDIIKLRDQISPSTKIVMNGDIEDRQHGEQLARMYGVDGIMIGRGVFKNPYIFAEVSPWESFSKEQKIAHYKRHVESFISTWTEVKKNPHGLKKFCKVYINGFDDASDIRDKVMACDSAVEILDLLNQYI
jgi:tRNA-dihydrouridine synthase